MLVSSIMTLDKGVINGTKKIQQELKNVTSSCFAHGLLQLSLLPHELDIQFCSLKSQTSESLGDGNQGRPKTSYDTKHNVK